MLLFKRTAKDAGRVSRSGFLGIECLRELCLLCGGIAVVMGLINGAADTGGDQLTTAMRAGAAAEAQPDLPIYRIDLMSNPNVVWIKRGDVGIDQVSLVTGQVLDRVPTFACNVSASAHSRDGRVHACGTNPGGLTIVRDGITLVDEPDPAVTGSVVNLTVTADGSRVAAADDKQRILIWNLAVSPPHRLAIRLETSPVLADWSVDGDRLLVGCGNGVVKMFSADGELVWSQKPDDHRTTAIAWSQDGTRVAVGQYGGNIIVLNARDGGLQWRSWHDSIQVSAVTFAPDGERLAASGFDRTVDVVSAADGRRLQTMPGHYDMVRALQFLPDGDRILSGSLDGTLRIWSASAGRQLQKM